MSRFHEMTWLEKVALSAPRELVRVETLAHVTANNRSLPIIALRIGPDDPTLPVFGLFAGVHGLEKVGTHVALSYLESLIAQLSWDRDLRRRFEHSRLLAVPILNPGGMINNRRSNPRGVDLMRNSPTEAEADTPFILGGHRISRRLPYYRGKRDSAMEPEARALVRYVEREMYPSRYALALDIHSGFGVNDRIWFPYAKTRSLIPDLSKIEAISRLLDTTYPNHVYIVEPQSESYTTHGDMWDYMYDRRRELRGDDGFFIPFTLEMGSWTWLRKNPRQLFDVSGPFNPLVPHRYRRTMRRHLLLIDFFSRAVRNTESWWNEVPLSPALPPWENNP